MTVLALHRDPLLLAIFFPPFFVEGVALAVGLALRRFVGRHLDEHDRLHQLIITRIVTALAVATTALPVAAEAPESHSPWKTYSNAALNYSFRYPHSLRLDRPPIASFGIEGLVDAIDLRNATQRSVIVLRVLVIETAGNPRIPPFDLVLLKQTCKTYEEFLIDGRLAFNCVSCGRAACKWGVVVPGARVFQILSLSRDGEESHPTDRHFPIRSIISSFRWHTRTAEADELPN
jgi:hypothetical protein